jgi:formylglycine-generating enzyme required for sulfatase activity
LLRDGQVTDKSLEHLKPMQKLTELHLEETKVTAAGIAALKAALPNCKVTWEPPAGQSMGAAPQPAKPPATPAAATPPPAIAPFDATKAKHHQEAWAKHLGVPVEATNSVGTALILVPPGEFMMGSTPEQIAWAVEEGKKKTQVDPWYFDCVSWEAPQHRVEITKPFYFGAYEVTQAEYEQVVGGNPSESKVDVRQPVENVSWFAAVAFCNRLSERERIQPYYEIDGQTVSIVGGDGYRLPTEAEWEYACRAGTTTKWYFGDDGSILGDYAWHEGNSGDKPHKVGEKKPNPWGLYDLYGSTSEWGWDRWTAHNPYEAKSVKDPTGPSDGPSRVLRGWAFSSAPLYLRSAYRGGTVPTWFHRTSGFRLAKTCLNARTVESPAALAPAGLSPASPKEAVKELNPLRSDEKPQPNDAGADGKVARAPRTTGASRRAVELRANDWIGLPQCWSVTRQGIMGSTGPTGINFNTFLCTRKTYRNFELHCQARLIAGNSGIQFRSEYVDRGKFVLRGPQVEIGIENWGSLFGEKTSGWMKIAPPQLTQRIVKANAFNDMFVRCVGKHVTIKINDETTVDDDFPTIADEGVIGLQLLSGRTEVMFRGIRLKELDDTKP